MRETDRVVDDNWDGMVCVVPTSTLHQYIIFKVGIILLTPKAKTEAAVGVNFIKEYLMNKSPILFYYFIL